MNKEVYLGRSVLEISKTLMYEFWYGYIKAKYQYIAKLCYMDTGSFIIHITTKMLMKTLPMMLKKDLAHQVMQSKDHCLQGKNKKVINDR